MKKQNVIDIISTALLVMFLYTAFSKYFDWGAFKRGMNNQHFSACFTDLLIYTLPPVEIAAGTLLLFTRTRFVGMLISLSLMTGFTVYVALVLIGYFAKVPCPCGGALKEMSWSQHLLFNLIFLAIAAVGTSLQWQTKREQLTN